MGKSKLDIFRQAAGNDEEPEKKLVAASVAPKEELVANIQETPKAPKTKKTKILAIEVMIEDLPRFDEAIFKLSSRDKVLYKRKDVYIAMTRYFFEALDKNIEKIKIEKL